MKALICWSLCSERLCLCACWSCSPAHSHTCGCQHLYLSNSTKRAAFTEGFTVDKVENKDSNTVTAVSLCENLSVAAM